MHIVILRARSVMSAVVAVSATGLMVWSNAASAQPSNVGVTSDPRGDATLGEIIVTAERRSENLQKVPLSATVLSAKDLGRRGAFNIQQLQYQTPGLSIQPALNAETFINIRGVGIQQTNPTSSNGVAFYVDGMYVPSLIATVDTFYDLKNVEVLRGPQGTLVGSNSDGGAIFVNSVAPSFDKVGGQADVRFGNYADRRIEAAVNVPLSRYVAARIAFVNETEDSFTRNLGQEPPSTAPQTYSNQPGNVDYHAVRVQLAFRPTENFELTLRYEPYESRTDGYAVKPDMTAVSVTSAAYDPYAASIQNQPFVIDYNTAQYYRISGERDSATAVWNITKNVELKSITSNQQGYESDLRDIDLSSAAADSRSYRRTSVNAFTQEIDLLSTSEAPLQWVLGAYYLHETVPLSLNQNFGPNAYFDAMHTNDAAFASVTYRFAPRWSVTFGGRYSHDDLPYHEYTFPALGNFDTSDTKPTGTVKLAWQATPETMAYASVSTGYKAGGVNLQLPAFGFTPPSYLPETNVVEEVGVKTTVLNDHLRLDGDVFDSQYDHYQLQENTSIGLPLTQGPGNAKIYGAEAEATGVFAAFRFNAGVSYLNAKVASNFPYTLPSGSTIVIPSGTTIPFSPEWMINAGAQYSIPMPAGRLTPRIQYQYQASQYTNIVYTIPLSFPFANLSDVVIPGHGTADVRLTYDSDANWSVQGYVTNITNRVYISNAMLSVGSAAPGFSYGPPRQFGADFSYHF